MYDEESSPKTLMAGGKSAATFSERLRCKRQRLEEELTAVKEVEKKLNKMPAIQELLDSIHKLGMHL